MDARVDILASKALSSADATRLVHAAATVTGAHSSAATRSVLASSSVTLTTTTGSCNEHGTRTTIVVQNSADNVAVNATLVVLAVRALLKDAAASTSVSHDFGATVLSAHESSVSPCWDTRMMLASGSGNTKAVGGGSVSNGLSSAQVAGVIIAGAALLAVVVVMIAQSHKGKSGMTGFTGLRVRIAVQV